MTAVGLMCVCVCVRVSVDRVQKTVDIGERECVCFFVCARMCVRACMRMCVLVCVCYSSFKYYVTTVKKVLQGLDTRQIIRL